MNYNNYPAIGQDLKIKQIQDLLESHLGFTNVDFYGRVQKSYDQTSKSYFPMAHIGNNELKDIYYDDKKAPGGNIFFIESDEHPSKDGIMFTSKIKIVFMLNLNKIIDDKTYRADSEIEKRCMLLTKKIGAFKVTAIEKGLKSILRDFNIDKIRFSEVQPYHIFSINGDLNYTF